MRKVITKFKGKIPLLPEKLKIEDKIVLKPKSFDGELAISGDEGTAAAAALSEVRVGSLNYSRRYSAL